MLGFSEWLWQISASVRSPLVSSPSPFSRHLEPPSQREPTPDATPSTPKDPRIGSLIESLSQTKTPTSVAISPDGATVAWSVRTHEGTQIHLSDVANPDSSKEKIVTTGSGAANCSSSDPKWSPDGESLAFVSDCTAKTDQSGQDQGISLVEDHRRIKTTHPWSRAASTLLPGHPTEDQSPSSSLKTPPAVPEPSPP